ncbi:hypothetical protein [Morganella morganii IS15]|nr:hypothetical protein [Morganella morganii IS15]
MGYLPDSRTKPNSLNFSLHPDFHTRLHNALLPDFNRNSLLRTEWPGIYQDHKNSRKDV